MAKVALINPSIKRKDVAGHISSDEPTHILPPIGLLTISGTLRKFGHEVYIIDAPGQNIKTSDNKYKLLSNDDIVEIVKRKGADYVGITSTIVSITSANNLARKLKAEFGDKLTIIFGGPQISAVFSKKETHEKKRGGGFYFNGMMKMPENRRKKILSRFDGMDYGIIGEGEKPLLDLITLLEKNEDPRSLPGLIFRYNERYEVNDDVDFITIDKILSIHNRKLPTRNLDNFGTGSEWIFPAYDLLENLTDYRPSQITYKTLPSISIITSRGCPQKCKFCDMSVHEHIFRKHSPEYLVELLKWLEQTWGYRDFYITDDQGTADPHFMNDFCDALEKAGKGGGYENGGYHFSIIGRVHPIHPEGLRRMAENGLHQIAFGLESAAEEILEFHNKRITIEKMIHGINIAHDIGLEVKGLFMAGSPGETTKTLEKTQKFIDSTQLEYISNSALTPIPGSELYEMATENLEKITINGSNFLGNSLGFWLEDPDNWDKMNLWEAIWVPKSLSDELGSPIKAKEYIEQFVRRKALKPANKDEDKIEIDWGSYHKKVENYE